MNYEVLFKEKLSKMLFLEVEKEGFIKTIGGNENIILENKDLYIPISSNYIASNIGEEIKIKNLPIYYFIEGMLISLGIDKNLRFSKDYVVILENIKDMVSCGKGLVATKVKNNELTDAYALLKGLYEITEDGEYIEKLLLVGNAIREEDKSFGEFFLKDIEVLSEFNKGLPSPYLYKAIIMQDKNEHDVAKVAINEYINKGGEVTKEIKNILNNIENVTTYEKGVELLETSPEKAIGLFLSLVDKFDENPLIYFYLGVAYRKIENYEKAIYYLRESLERESGILEVVVELGINYACLSMYEEALTYFKKAFEASRDVEICTNIIMCYLNLGNITDAKKHLNIAKELDSNDEIVKQLDNMMK
ncbi:MAG: tetratricopeptide repeat protein [Clostridium sp.]